MNWTAAEAVARAILYEGYLLYPYRTSALKNRRRSMFGTIEPGGVLLAEGLVEGGPETRLAAKLRFLRDLSEGTVEREVPVEGPLRQPFEEGVFELAAEPAEEGFLKLTLRVENTGQAPLLSCHVLAGVRGGAFVSATDPLAARCEGRGLWLSLVGRPGDRSLVLASPILLPDYPSVAPESPRDLFDLTEIDEILSLRLMTLSEAEREEIRREGGRARELLDHVDGLTGADLLAMHGRPPGPRIGDRVRLRPAGRADIMDLALAGKEAVVVALEEDVEGRRYVAVTVKDDPGRDLGELGYLGHRFFFRPEEVEPL